jgi:hypothetical protein
MPNVLATWKQAPLTANPRRLCIKEGVLPTSLAIARTKGSNSVLFSLFCCDL